MVVSGSGVVILDTVGMAGSVGNVASFHSAKRKCSAGEERIGELRLG